MSKFKIKKFKNAINIGKEIINIFHENFSNMAKLPQTQFFLEFLMNLMKKKLNLKFSPQKNLSIMNTKEHQKKIKCRLTHSYIYYT